MSEVRKALRRFVKNNQSGMRLFVGKVVSVDENAKTCSLDPLDGNPTIYKVRLKPELNSATGSYAIPKKGSYVFAAELGDENNVCVLQVEKATKYVIQTDNGTIELNGNGSSMVKAETLEQELNKLKAVVDAIVQSLTTWGPVANDGGAALKATATAALAAKTTGNFSNIKNSKVKHG